MNTRSALIVFAREPKDGKVKTRLSKDLPLPAVTRLYKAFVKDVLNIAWEVPCDERIIYYAGNSSSIPFLRKVARRFRLKRQMGRDLGERMHKAFEYCQKNKFQRIALIGTDCLTMTQKDIEQAFEKLKDYDCVLGPAKDGGYYLIALKHPLKYLFTGIDWGTPAVLKQTLIKARKKKKKVFLLPQREDIDNISHLKSFTQNRDHMADVPNTQKILKNIPLLVSTP